MPDINSLTTFSGLLALFGTLALLSRRWLAAAALFIVAGAGGTGVFWDRWSQRAGEQVHVTALLSGQPPSGDETAMLATHAPLLIMGLLMLTAVSWRNRREREGR